MNGRRFFLMELSTFRPFGLMASIERSDPGLLEHVRIPHARSVELVAVSNDRPVSFMFSPLVPRIHETNPCVIPLPALCPKRFTDPLRTLRSAGVLMGSAKSAQHPVTFVTNGKSQFRETRHHGAGTSVHRNFGQGRDDNPRSPQKAWNTLPGLAQPKLHAAFIMLSSPRSLRREHGQA